MGLRFGGAPGCCCESCTIFRDTFDSDDLGSNWDQRAGTWAIAGGNMTVSAGASLNIYNDAHPDAIPEMYVYASMKGTAADDTARVVIGYVDDNNYFFGQIRFTGTGGAGTPQVRLGRVNAGVESYLTSETAGNLDGSGWATLAMCYVAGRLTLNEYDGVPPASIGDTVISASSATNVTVTGTKCGVAVGVQTGTVSFGQFDFEYYISGDHPTCRGCRENCAACSSGTTPYAMQVTFHGVADNDCASCDTFFNDATFILRPTGTCTFALSITLCTGSPANDQLTNIGGSMCGGFPTRRYPVTVYSTNRIENTVTGTSYLFDSTCGGPFDCGDGVSGRSTGNTGGFPTSYQCDWSGATIDVVALGV